MKKILLFTVTIALFSLSCKKSSTSGSPYYIKASVDGTPKTFNVNAMAMKMSVGMTSISVVGNVKSAADLEGINITINNSPSGKPIVAGTYSESDATDFAAAAVYNPGSQTIVWGAGDYPNPPHPLTIVITSIDDKTIKGTFSGDFYYTNTATAQFGPDKKTFTNGEFYVKF
ncbi:hypothetical protein Q4E93_29650 [Flavitalea sp. BT771]|uniref:hypothetical protein n=1 Tax=Flavitalea sp. BT771 TaxID=3063329 RepID=UPI0026E22E97|nr:hypothetical protein [Flavitalea sp. BT771]MDO6434814.1 hypothetical protein [Flavitalea sp. BT771]MDV6223714.1 hypothetical protein [Flavitalea sp. BT771]